MSNEAEAGGEFARILKAAVDDDDQDALGEVMAEVYQVAARIGKCRLFYREAQENYPSWACEALRKRRASARAKGVRKDPLAYAADVVNTLHTSLPDLEQRKHFRGIIGNSIKGKLLATFLEQCKQQAERDKSLFVPFDERKKIAVPAPTPPSDVARKAVKYALQWYESQSLRAWVVLHLRCYNLHNSELPEPVVLYVQAIQEALAGDRLLHLPPAAPLEDYREKLEALLSDDGVLDGKNLVRWEVVAALLDTPRGTLETECSRMRKRYKSHLQEHPAHD